MILYEALVQVITVFRAMFSDKRAHRAKQITTELKEGDNV